VSAISKILVVLANPEYEQDSRAVVVTTLCKEFMETVQKNGITVDLIDLYNDEEFNPVLDPESKDTKTLEFQIRLRKADMVVFFHPIWWAMVPSILKGFLDKVLNQGFAYSVQKGITTPLLDEKRALVFAVGEKPAWEIRFMYRDILKTFWERIIFKTSGLQGRLFYFGSLRSINQKQIDSWSTKVNKLANNINSKSEILELF
jgi:NAD(P)H dehydrogenase (quinone)